MENRFLNLFCFVILTIAAQVSVSSGAAISVPAAREPPIEASSCPAPELIEPCSCEYDDRPPYTIVIRCSNYLVNQASIKNLFRELRRANDIPADRGVEIGWFIMSGTDMAQLDLEPFYGSRFSHLNFIANFGLTQVVTSGNESDYGSIHAYHSFFGTCPLLRREGLGDALKYYSNEISEFGAYDIGLVENEEDTEFLPYLSSHTNLTYLDFDLNNIRRLNGGAFKGLQRLEKIQMGSSGLSYIGEGALDFSPDGAKDGDLVADPNLELDIYLGLDALNQASFHPNSGLGKSGRRTSLHFIENTFTTIPMDVFLGYLEDHPQNYVAFERNPIVCDQRLSWLKERRDEFESKVRANCADSLTSIFDSNLVP